MSLFRAPEPECDSNSSGFILKDILLILVVPFRSGKQVVSVYRQILFLTLVALGQDNIDLTAFDR